MGYQYMFEIHNQTYFHWNVQSAKIEAPLFDKLSVGNTCCAELDITFWPYEGWEIPRNALIVPKVQQDNGIWLPLGYFFIDTRAQSGEALHVVAYDAMMAGEAEFVPEEWMEFPMTMDVAVSLIANRMNVDIDERTVVSSDYTIDYPVTGQTLRETLGWIGAAHGGNWIMTNEGKLLLVPLFDSAPAETSNLVTEGGETILFGGVSIQV